MPPFARRVIAPAKAWARVSPDDLEKMIARVSQSEVEGKMLGLLRSTPPGDRTRYLKPVRALEALLLPDSQNSLAAVGDSLAAEGLKLGDIIGAGQESLVFGVTPRTGPDRHVLKVSVDTGRHHHGEPMRALDGVEGVTPYWIKKNFGPLWMGVQERADAVLPTHDKPREIMQGWEKMADRLNASLDSRGYFWSDNIPHNMGIMPGGKLSVIDGNVRELLPAEVDGFLAADVPSAGPVMVRGADGLLYPRPPKMSPEEAIRALLLTPEDRDLIRRTGLSAP